MSFSVQFNSVQSLSRVQLFVNLKTTIRQAFPSITKSQSLPYSCPLSKWCHLTISSSVIPFSSCLQPLPASGSFLMSWLFSSGGQSIGASASASVLPMNIQGWFPLGLTGLISLQSKGLSRAFSTAVLKHQFFGAHPKNEVVAHMCVCVLCHFSRVWLFATPWTVAHQASLSSSISRSLLKFMFIELVMLSNHLILCRPLLLLPSIFPSIRVFSNESALRIRWPKFWSFSFSISPSKYSELISFRMDWLDLLAVEGTLKSLLQHHSSKASVLRSSAFFIVQLSHPYMTTGKTIALTRRTLVGKVMPLLWNILSRLVITFLPRSKVF